MKEELRHFSIKEMSPVLNGIEWEYALIRKCMDLDEMSFVDAAMEVSSAILKPINFPMTEDRLGELLEIHQEKKDIPLREFELHI